MPITSSFKSTRLSSVCSFRYFPTEDELWQKPPLHQFLHYGVPSNSASFILSNLLVKSCPSSGEIPNPVFCDCVFYVGLPHFEISSTLETSLCIYRSCVFRLYLPSFRPPPGPDCRSLPEKRILSYERVVASSLGFSLFDSKLDGVVVQPLSFLAMTRKTWANGKFFILEINANARTRRAKNTKKINCWSFLSYKKTARLLSVQ